MTTMTTHRRTRRLAAAVSALALGLLGVAGVVGPASADTVSGVGNIDASKSGQTGTGIVVHKYEKSASNGTTAGTGAELGTAPGTAIQGANFTITPVRYSGNPIDLLTNTGWTQANAAQSSFNAATTTFSDANVSLGTESAPITTDVNGEANFDALGFGMYLVREVTPLATQVISPAQPFLVTVPFPTGAADATAPNNWLYTVHAYPKNAVTGVTKSVNSTDAGFLTAGDYLSWTITSDVPVLAQGGSLTTFTVTDTVVDGELDFVTSGLPAGISDWSVVVNNASGSPVAFTAGTDYAITSPITASTTVVDLTFTAAGRTKLETSAQGGQVIFTVPTQVVAVPAGGTVTNQGDLQVNNAHENDPASTDFGKLRVLKYAVSDDATPATKTPLAGATFQLYVDLDQDGVVDAGEIDPANLVSVAGVNSWTTNASGLLDVAALKVGKYFLVETAAPVGYQLASTPHAVTIVAGDVVTTAGSEQNYLEVENDQVPPWLLPFTGGNGVLTFTLVGAGLMALALGFALVAFRRRRTEA